MAFLRVLMLSHFVTCCHGMLPLFFWKQCSFGRFFGACLIMTQPRFPPQSAGLVETQISNPSQQHPGSFERESIHPHGQVHRIKDDFAAQPVFQTFWNSFSKTTPKHPWENALSPPKFDGLAQYAVFITPISHKKGELFVILVCQ